MHPVDPPPTAQQSLFHPDAHAHMVGIGGVGMSGLARLLRARGVRVTGTDAEASAVTASLGDSGIPVAIGQESILPPSTTVLVASAAVKPDHPALLAADVRGIPAMVYAEALGHAMARTTGIAVAGTHGKSTTAAMLSAALIDSGLDPSVIVGAACPHLTDEHGRPTGFRIGAHTIPTGVRRGQPGLLVAEACEFNRSFHHLSPRIASIANLEADHLDVYGTLDAVIDAFRRFAAGITGTAENPGTLLIGHDTAHRREVSRGLACTVETIGFNPSADWHLSIETNAGRLSVVVRRHGVRAAAFDQPMPGEHGAFNAGVAFALASLAGAEHRHAAEAIGAFRGVHRRFERLGERLLPHGGAVTVYDDYGHHPTEVDVTIRALRQHERIDEQGRRLVCVFQPHQHSRTRFFLDEFAAAFTRADVVIVPDIYFVRDTEAERQLVSAGDLVDRLRARGTRAMHVYPFDAIVEQIEAIARPGDVLLVMGAGPVWRIAHRFVGRRTQAPEPVAGAAT